MHAPVRAVLAGRVKPFARGEGSAIAKQPLEGSVRITLAGVAGDEQADLVHHGGRDKALHHYPFDHYASWAERAPDARLLDAEGAFGENISTTGLLEHEVCIGDRFRIGTALVEISQGRKPCWKQGARLGWDAVPALMVREGRSGWYYRVIEEGEAKAGDVLALVERQLPDWSVRRVFDLLIAGKHKSDPAALKALAGMDLLFDGWRERAARLMGN
jgi:MOSC domain-containing protein YiiM